jgi:sugar phosphate isomerase/epimerase
MAADLGGTLKEIGAIGYKGVELWFPEWPDQPDDLKRMVADAGLKVPSSHVPFRSLRDNLDHVAEFHRALGTRYLTIPNIPPDLRQSEEEWKSRVTEIAAIGRACKDAGFQLAYHNHAFEFEATIDGVEIHDYIFSHVEEDLLKTELDTFFIADVGKDPADYIRRFGERMPILHLKEKHPSPDYMNAEVGQGTIDWDAVFKAAEGSAVEWYVVEQNCQENPPLESIRISFEYLAGRGLV